MLAGATDAGRKARTDPAVGESAARRHGGGCSTVALRLGGLQHVARGVPELVAEVAVALDAADVEGDVARQRGERGERHAQGVRAIGGNAVGELLAGRLLNGRRKARLHQAAGALLDQFLEADAIDQVERVEDVAFRLRHLLAFRVPDQAVDVDFTERHVLHEVQAQHDHAGDPEEDDVEAGHEDGCRVEGGELRRLLGPAQRRIGPQGRREPGVQHVLVLAERHGVAVPGQRLRRGTGFVPCHVDVAVAVIPGRDPVSPPQLPADAPVLDAVHPVEVGALPVLGHEADPAVLDGADGRFGERRDAHVPLVGQPRLDDGVGAVTARHHQRVRIDVIERAFRLEQRQHGGAGLFARQAANGSRYRRKRLQSGRVVAVGCGDDPGVAIEDVQQRQVVARTQFVVIEVVRGRDLHAARAEGRVDVVVGNDRDQAAGDRQADLAADEGLVALIGRMHRDGRIAEQGLGPGRGDRQRARAVRKRVAQVPELALFLGRQHLEVRQRGVQHGVPVDQALAAVDQPFLVQPDEGFGDRL